MRNCIFVCLSVCLCSAGGLFADTRWTGAVSQFWSNPANWTNGVPDADQKAQFASATVTDDGFLKPYTVKWSIDNEPNAGMAVLGSANVEDTTVTLSAVGQYILKLEANDGEYTGSDTITINVYSNSCEAAKSVPGYQALPGDLNGDCVVNDADLAILQAHWLQCNALDCNDVK
ncbi:MAG: hypothetical protein A2Y76_09620 [Planctomycetes bacterium RBG_13_60_9]|nr:MAG: hypothetical protein A2Y76_09620 [Planctomycetes bacterium RBG_13_60_9]